MPQKRCRLCRDIIANLRLNGLLEFSFREPLKGCSPPYIGLHNPAREVHRVFRRQP